MNRRDRMMLGFAAVKTQKGLAHSKFVSERHITFFDVV